MDYKIFGKEFCERYYYYFQHSMDQLSGAFMNNSMITFNGTEHVGYFNYANYFRSWLGAYNMITSIESPMFDVHPIDNDKFFITVTARLKFNKSTYYTYSLNDFFFIVKVGDKYFIKNMISRITENRMF